ncbi:hypothetical protein F0250_23215, partial [Vibrio cyclitrophicus]|uniref:lipopolysaccharide biosynthesis protein n=1 Tax=Vibrio cyclitrophicus TaxID=47951 RepID=UPI00148E111C
YSSAASDVYKRQNVDSIFLLLIVSFIIGLLTNLYKQLLFATHKSALVDIIYVVQQATIIIIVYLISKKSSLTLTHVAIVNGIVPIIISVIFTIGFFNNHKDLIPNRYNFNSKYISDIFSLGGRFFFIQLSSVIIYSTDNVIISKYLGSSAVSYYDITGRIFQSVIMFWYIISSPLTALYSNAYYKNDFIWIVNIIKKLNLIYILVIILVVLLALFTPAIINIWIGDEILSPISLISFFAAFVLIRIYGDLYMPFLNAIGILNYQLYLTVFGAIINIPLSIFLIKFLDLGSSSVILATCISLLPLALIAPFQAYKAIYKGNKGNEQKYN